MLGIRGRGSISPSGPTEGPVKGEEGERLSFTTKKRTCFPLRNKGGKERKKRGGGRASPARPSNVGEEEKAVYCQKKEPAPVRAPASRRSGEKRGRGELPYSSVRDGRKRRKNRPSVFFHKRKEGVVELHD